MAMGELTFLGLSIIVAGIVYGVMQMHVPLQTGRLTRLFAYAMSAHAIINLVTVSVTQLTGAWEVFAVAEASAVVFVAVYFYAALHHDENSAKTAIALALGSYVAMLMLMAMGQMAFSLRLFAYTSVIAGAAIAVACIAHHPAAQRIK
ncbi:MAG TPA: hypothetical protein VGG27_12580 [Magnetospirillaceae bacterium]|jgi:hypothetical protein